MTIDIKRFEEDIKLLEKKDKKNCMLFYGSSTFTKWDITDIKRSFPLETIVNNGFGGSVAEEALYYSDRLVFPFRPKILCYYEGDNDAYCGYTPSKAFSFTKSLLDKITDIKIYVFSVKFSLSRIEKIDYYKEYNQLSWEYCLKRPNAYYIDFNKNLLKGSKIQNKYFMDDMLHLNSDGYAVVAKELKKVIKMENNIKKA